MEADKQTATEPPREDTAVGDIGLSAGQAIQAVPPAKTPPLTFAKRQLAWLDQVDRTTLHRAWRSLNGGYGHYGYSFAEFEDAFAATTIVTATQEEFADLSVENTCRLDVADEVAAAGLAVGTGALEPVILARFESRVAILDGNTRYRATLLCQSDIHYVCVSMGRTSCCVPM